MALRSCLHISVEVAAVLQQLPAMLRMQLKRYEETTHARHVVALCGAAHQCCARHVTHAIRHAAMARKNRERSAQLHSEACTMQSTGHKPSATSKRAAAKQPPFYCLHHGHHADQTSRAPTHTMHMRGLKQSWVP
jgi:hypothetical protein